MIAHEFYNLHHQGEGKLLIESLSHAGWAEVYNLINVNTYVPV